ncbi:ATP-binding protein [bacterium]|nr:ATP-binding protein [bacterium]
MTKVENLGINLKNKPTIIEDNSKNVYKINFKNDNASKNNQRVTRPAILQQPTQDSYVRMVEQQQKEQKKAKNKQNLSWGLGIAVSVAFLAVLIPQIFGKGGVKQEVQNLTQTAIRWKDFATTNGKRQTAEITAGTTHKNLCKEYELIKNQKTLSEKAKEWVGITEQADVYYTYGFGGTGKTYFPEQIAETEKAIFACVKYPDLGSPYKDAASMKIASFFDEIVSVANKNSDRPIVVCIDESDALIQKVAESHASEEAKKIRSAVITGIDKVMKEAKNVKLFLTSNYHPESGLVDDVVLRRVNKKIKVDLPDYEQADALIQMYLSGRGAVKPELFKSPEYKDFVNSIITKEKDLGYSGGEIKNIVKEAINKFASTIKGVPDNELEKHVFDVKYLKEALSTVGNPAARTNTTMLTKEERKHLMH